ncbi:MAG: DUF222 domain-containing protein [Chloroflexi bacterium]|nr:MAG: DUF222 domain-containing protein [Chloroflexota bacterium]
MPHADSMCRASETPLDRMRSALRDMPAWLAEQPGGQLGDVIITSREIIDGTEAVAAEATRRFEQAGGYKADGFLGMVPWLRVNGKLSGGAAAERVETARQLKELPRTEEALARGEIGYQHAVAMARAAEHVGAAQVRQGEASLLKAAESMDPGQFVSVARNFEHQVDAQAALDGARTLHEAGQGRPAKRRPAGARRPGRGLPRRCRRQRATAVVDHPCQSRHPGRHRRGAGRRARLGRHYPGGDGTAACLRFGHHPDHRTG